MTDKVTKLALASRLIVLTLQLLANVTLPDHRPDVFRAPISSDSSNHITSWFDRLIQHTLGGMRHWDGEYFLHIAEHSYTYENTLAFYPLYPLLIHIFGHALHYLCGGYNIISIRSSMLLVAVIINLMLFCYAANLLYTLTQRIFNDPTKSWNAALLFCFNPATVFFSAAYSETLFAVLTLQLMVDCVTSRENSTCSIRTALSSALSAVTRSNGLLNFGYPAYYTLRKILLIAPSTSKETWRWRCLILIFELLIWFVAAIFPLTFFNFYAYRNFCTATETQLHSIEIITYANERGYLLAGIPRTVAEQSPWCDATIPMPYGYVQRHYWDVGFLRYYHFRQLPQFILAAPIIAFLVYHCISDLHHSWTLANRSKAISPTKSKPTFQSLILTVIREHISIPFTVHALCLTIISALFVHVQVATRLLCAATPCLYWFAADHMPRTLDQVKVRSKAAAIILWFGGYGVLGCLFFSNNYPWT